MIPAQTPLTEAEKNFLEQQLQLKPKTIEPLKSWLDPHSSKYWWMNGMILAGSVYGRMRAVKLRAPTIFWSAAIVAVPAFTLASVVKLDTLSYKFGHRKTLEERLDLSPVTRRAWERAVKENAQYQEGLKRQISQLKSQSSEKKTHDE